MTMPDELVERVAQAVAVEIYRIIEQDARAHEMTKEEIKALGTAAIAVALEEAATVAETLGGSVRRGNIIEALYIPPTAKDAAAAIRAMIGKEGNG